MSKNTIYMTVFCVTVLILSLLIYREFKKIEQPVQHTTETTYTGDTKVPPENPFAEITKITGDIDTSTPEQTVKTCYRMYLYSASDSYLVWDTSTDDVPPEVSKCFTSSFLQRLRKVGSYNVMLSQDALKEWIPTIKTELLSQSEVTSEVNLTYGTTETGISNRRINLILMQESGWQIDVVTDTTSTTN